MKVKLLGIHACPERLEFIVGKSAVVLGRGPDADLRIQDRWVSRVHCALYDLEGTLVVRDLDSHNGTLVNGTRITETHLMPGDRLTVGLTVEVKYKPAHRRARALVGAAGRSTDAEQQAADAQPRRVMVDFEMETNRSWRPRKPR